MDCFVSSVRVIVIFTESITNHRNIICYKMSCRFTGKVANMISGIPAELIHYADTVDHLALKTFQSRYT